MESKRIRVGLVWEENFTPRIDRLWIPFVMTRGRRWATPGREHVNRASPPSETDDQLSEALLREEYQGW
jgi:hypothetical protein